MLVSNMIDETHGHANPEELEKYSLGSSTAEQAARVEEHLLVCEPCRRKLERIDEYHTAMKSAAAELKKPAKARWGVAALAAAACILLAATIGLRWQRAVEPAFLVDLAATRSNQAVSVPSGRTLELHPDLTGLPGIPTYQMEMVNSTGKQVWHGALTAPRTVVTVPGQRSGYYYIRVYKPTGEILREYGLQIGT